MAKLTRKLAGSFRPEKYVLRINPDAPEARLLIHGQKAGRPSKRFSFHQKELRVSDARITALGKEDSQVEVSRINHLPKIEQVRIHTKEMLYPGRYRIELEYRLPRNDSIKAVVPSRECLPCVDEAEAWAKAKLEIKQPDAQP